MPHEIISTIKPLRTSPAASIRRPRVAIFCPASFAADRPFLVALFFHGFESLCACGHRRPFEESLRRHEIAQQLAQSNVNAIVLAPRLALGPHEHRRGLPFISRRSTAALLREAAYMAADLIQAPRAFTTAFMQAPLVLAGFSGGHHALSALATQPDIVARTKAIAFFDALYDSDRYAEDPRGLLRHTALICINRKHYDRDNGPKEANYRHRLPEAGIVPQRLDAVRSIRRGTAIIERVAWREHCTMVAGVGALSRVLGRIDGVSLCR